MQTNTDHQAATESTHRICGQVFRRTDSIVGLQVGRNITAGKISRLLVLIVATLFLHLERVRAFEIIYPGQLSDGHWDSLEKVYDPQSQITSTRLSGNSRASHGMGGFVVRPQAGDLQNGNLQLKVGYRATETVRQNLLNFNPAPFDYHYAFNYRMTFEIDTPHLPGPAHPLEETGAGTGFFLVEVPIGVRFYLELDTDASNVHLGWGAKDWHPTVIDPTMTGSAYLYIRADISLVSMEVVPEPTTAVMTLLGASLLGRTFRRRAR